MTRTIILWLIVTLLPSPVLAQLKSFTAVYAAAYQGNEVGEGRLMLSHNNNQYQLDLKIEPTGLLAIIPFSIKEQSLGQWGAKGVQPSQYRYTRSGVGKKRKETVLFSTQGIRREYKGQHSQIPYDPNLKDPLSLILQVMWDLNQQQLKSQYRLLNRGKIKDYPIQDLGEAVLNTPLGNLQARHIRRADDEQRIDFWFGTAVGFVPLKIVQYEDNKEELRLSIIRLERR